MEPFGNWQLESILAVGGMGEVWRASHPRFGAAAVKRIHTHLQRSDEAMALFAAEQRLTSTTPRHPHLVYTHEVGDVEGRPYLALQLAPGDDLRKADLPMPRARILAIAIAACDAIAHLHAHGYVHGDVCPGNLIVDGDAPVVVDLGVARAIGAGGPMRGTHAYMAPEQVRGEVWTAATDVFALGVVIWELATGTRLFHRGPPWLSMAAVLDTVPAKLGDAALDAIVVEALIKDPTARTPGARELATQLRGL